jgi:hypothetical protein
MKHYDTLREVERAESRVEVLQDELRAAQSWLRRARREHRNVEHVRELFTDGAVDADEAVELLHEDEPFFDYTTAEDVVRGFST